MPILTADRALALCSIDIWFHRLFGGGFCTIGTHFSVASSPYSKIRLAARAAALAIFFTDPRKVSASIGIPSVI